MPPPGHKSVTITWETWLMIEELRDRFPLQVTQGEVIRSALMVLHDQPDPLEAISKAKRGKKPSRAKKKG